MKAEWAAVFAFLIVLFWLLLFGAPAWGACGFALVVGIIIGVHW